jgi:hypothetical protein
MSESEDDIAGVLRAEEEAMSVAEQHVMRYSPFDKLPEEVAIRYTADWMKILAKSGISKREVLMMAQSDFAMIVRQMRGKTASMPHLGSVRFAALIHVAMYITIEATLAMDALWHALKVSDFESASEELLMSNYPLMVGTSPEERRRVLDLARMMRTGILTTSWSLRTH